MKTSLIFLSLLTALLFFAGCGQNKKTGTVTVQVKAKYGNQAFALNTPNTDPNGRRIQVDNFKFYLSHIKLVKTDNSEVEIRDVILCDMSNPLSLTFNAGFINDNFKAIRFSCGIDSVQNATDPNTITGDSNPLSNASDMYWPWLKYKFQSMEARVDTTTNATGTFTWYPIYHIGSNAYYRTTELSKIFSVCCSDEYKLNVVLDVEKIFFGAQTLDIISERITQSGS